MDAQMVYEERMAELHGEEKENNSTTSEGNAEITKQLQALPQIILIDEESLSLIRENPLSAKAFLLPNHPLPIRILLKTYIVLGTACLLFLVFNLIRLTLLISDISVEFKEDPWS